MKLFTACADSDGLKGFYYSHDGFWAKSVMPGSGYEYKGHKTKMECANSCLQNCVAITTSDTSSNGYCYHYSNNARLVIDNQHIVSKYKAYIKCSGTN